MLEENMRFVGAVNLKGNLPCIACGEGNQCGSSAIKMLYGKDATPATIGINDIDNQPETIAALEKLGRDIVETYYSV